MLENYPGTPATRDALIVLIENYNKLEMVNLAETTADVLIGSFPNYTYTLNKNNHVIIKDGNEKNTSEKKSFFDFSLF